MRALLEICSTALAEIGFPTLDAVAGSSDDTAVQMLALANREGSELAARTGGLGGWQQLIATQTLITVAGQAAYDEPADLAYYVNQSGWDNDRRIELLGPLSAQSWQFIKHAVYGYGYGTRFRIINNQVNLDPVPSSTQTFSFEYYSKNWCQDARGAPQALFDSDSDVPRLPDDLFIMGLKWRFLRAKRLDFAFELEEYNQAVDRELSRTSQARVLSLNNEQGVDERQFEAFG